MKMSFVASAAGGRDVAEWNTLKGVTKNACTKVEHKYDAVIVAVNHDEYAKLTKADFDALLTKNGLLVDVKGIYRHMNQEFEYLSL